MTVGRELASLRELHQMLVTSAQDLERVAGGLDRALESSVWTGPRSEEFLRTWSALRPSLAPGLVDDLNAAQADVRQQHNNLAAATGETDRL